MQHKKYYAKSASDKTDDWPYWFVANQSGVNVTVQLLPELSGYMPFLPKEVAVLLAEKSNEKTILEK